MILHTGLRTDIPGFYAPWLVQRLREGVVTTGGGRLNIRTGPSLESTVIGQIPNGTRVTITGQEGDWYTVSHNGLNGYVYGQYITIE